ADALDRVRGEVLPQRRTTVDAEARDRLVDPLDQPAAPTDDRRDTPRFVDEPDDGAAEGRKRVGGGDARAHRPAATTTILAGFVAKSGARRPRACSRPACAWMLPPCRSSLLGGMSEELTVVVVDDNPNFRAAVVELINEMPEFACVGEAASGEA